jgi:hypothetical protein
MPAHFRIYFILTQRKQLNMNSNLPFQSRWGFHPCNYELFVQLKALHKHYWQSLYDFHRWHRWWRKQPENRRGAEPRVSPLFLLDQPWYKPVQIHGVAGFKVYLRTVVDHGIVALYQAARRPQLSPVEPFDATTVQRIAELHSRLQEQMQ